MTQKGQVTIPLPVREALGIRPGSEVRFELDRKGARLVMGAERAAEVVDAMVGAGEGEPSSPAMRTPPIGMQAAPASRSSPTS